MRSKEFDLLDMITEVLSHWRGLVVALLAGAIIFGIFSFANSYSAVQNEQSQQDIILNETTTQEQLEQVKQNLDEVRKAAVLTVIEDEKENALREAYFQNSVYMQLDPLKVAQTELIYQIQTEDSTNNGQLGMVYKELLNSAGLYNRVAQELGIAEEYVGELITVDTKSDVTIQLEAGEISLTTNYVKITIMETNEEKCKQLASIVKSYIVEQNEKLLGELGNHNAVLLSESAGIVMNKELMDDQIKRGNDITLLQSTIATAKGNFNDEQKKYYQLLTNEETEGERTQLADIAEIEKETEVPSVSKKYVLLGAVLFAFIYAAALCMGYIFNTRVRENDEIQTLYHIPQIGLVVRDSGKKIFLDRWIDDLRHYGKRKFTAEQSMELAFAAVKIATIKNSLNHIGLMGCNMNAGSIDVCEKLKTALEKENISVTILDNVLYDAEVMEQIDSVQGIVLVEKAGSTLYNEIVNELDLLQRQKIVVLGGIIVE